MLLSVSAALSILPAIALALPSSSYNYPDERALASRGLVKRQTSIPEVCTYICQDIEYALSSCGDNSTCLCNTRVLNSFLNCSECTLLNTQQSNINVSILSYQYSIDAYRQSCSMTTPTPIILPNVTVTRPAANLTFPTSAPSNQTGNSTSHSSSVSSSHSSSVSSSSSSSALPSSSSMSSTSSSSASISPTVSSAAASSSTSAISGANILQTGWVTGVVIGLAGLALSASL
ncbi:hypothetical protein [Phaffia rhodozyma]|uniref:Extracellular membrane protein, CFEM domain n=1 Tax=Phaffia rhodozyma TaxID=264483 RepID=A0A0F7SLZ3_PHARH|nr:hypothetical protein [Phaffia rhodozyma]